MSETAVRVTVDGIETYRGPGSEFSSLIALFEKVAGPSTIQPVDVYAAFTFPSGTKVTVALWPTSVLEAVYRVYGPAMRECNWHPVPTEHPIEDWPKECRRG